MALHKAVLGNRIRRLRQERSLSQKEMADKLGISASYLNLIEHDERPATVALILKLGQVFKVDLHELSDRGEHQLAMRLQEVFADAGLPASEVSAEEIRKLVAAAPAAGKAIVALHRAWHTAREDAQTLQIDLPSGRTQRVVLPAEEVRDFFEAHGNHFPAVEAAAEAAALPRPALGQALADRLAQRHGVSVDIASLEAMAGALMQFDPRARRLVLSEGLPRPSRYFHMAYQLGLIEAQAEIEDILAAAKLSSPEAAMLCRIGLANYFAGAILMPYEAFLAEARATRYDIEALTMRFDVSFEQAAHRLSTLQRLGNAGVPFFFVRADIAGNISKRFSAAGFYFSRFGGSCARFVVHEAFGTPGRICRQIARLPDGSTFFAIARTLDRGSGGFNIPVSHHAVGLGCEIARASELVYADGLDLAQLEAATEIGLGCRLCERTACRQRAFPPLQHRLVVDATLKGPSAYAFRNPG